MKPTKEIAIDVPLSFVHEQLKDVPRRRQTPRRSRYHSRKKK